MTGYVVSYAESLNGCDVLTYNLIRFLKATQLYRSGTHTIAEICSLAGISKPTLYAYVAEFSEDR